MTNEYAKNKPSQRQSYLDRLCRSSEAYARELELSVLNPLNSWIKQKQYIDSTFSALVVIRSHLEKAIKRLEALSKECFIEWDLLYKENKYW